MKDFLLGCFTGLCYTYSLHYLYTLLFPILKSSIFFYYSILNIIYVQFLLTIFSQNLEMAIIVLCVCVCVIFVCGFFAVEKGRGYLCAS